MADEKHNELDRVLDAALAKYAAVEPRLGLQERVLASLHAEQARAPERQWWRWIVAGGLAAVAVVALAVAWRSGRTHALPIATHPSIASPTLQQSGTQATAKSSATRKSTVGRASPKVELAANPRLELFPSPHPLTEQEKILASYVEQYPERSVLLARARTEALRQDELEEMQAPSSSDWATDSEDRNHETTER